MEQNFFSCKSFIHYYISLRKLNEKNDKWMRKTDFHPVCFLHFLETIINNVIALMLNSMNIVYFPGKYIHKTIVFKYNHHILRRLYNNRADIKKMWFKNNLQLTQFFMKQFTQSGKKEYYYVKRERKCLYTCKPHS